MKPLRGWAAVTPGGDYKRAADGHIPLYENPDGARFGWGLGFTKPAVVKVEIRAMKKRKTKPKKGY